MSFIYTPAKERWMKATLDMDTVDIRLMLCMTNTTADTDQDAGTLAAITTHDEYDGSGYSIVAATGEIVNRDDPNNRAEFDIADLAPWFAALGAGTRQAAGILVYAFIDGTDANDQPIAWVDTGGFPFSGNGGAVNLTINAEGLLQIT